MKSKGAAGKRELLQKEVEGGRENENVNSVVRVCEDALGEKVEEQYKSTRKPSLVEVSDSSVGNLDVPVEEPKKARAKRNLKTARAVAGSVECGVEKMKSKGATGKRELLQKEVEAGRENENVNSVVRVCDDAPGEKVEEHKSTRNRSLVEVSDSSVGNLDAPVEEPKNTRLTRNPKNARAVTGNVEKKKSDGVTEKRELLQKEVGDGRKKEKVNSGDGNWPDLNNMTLGEWFDFLEVHLPKQIIDETEEIIDSMMQKAERLREYIAEMQQQNNKGKMAMEE
uniref:FHA domain-containing protein At4g14490 n=2 Tax=Cajanus cajan TaxID=3821 RepID=A0A151UAG8_CAJCA|nr:FHA domain-containing protein At4g14490 [Cajanus cajan]